MSIIVPQENQEILLSCLYVNLIFIGGKIWNLVDILTFYAIFSYLNLIKEINKQMSTYK